MRPAGTSRPAGTARPAGSTRPGGSARARTPLLLAMGDSITAGSYGMGDGTTMPTADRFAYKLAVLLSARDGVTWQVWPSAITGGTSTGVLETNRAAWDTITPDLVVLGLGINDDDAALATWQANIEAAVPLILAHGSLTAERILICGLPPFGSQRYGGVLQATWDNWNAGMRTTTESLGCTFVPVAGVYDSGLGQYNPVTDPSNVINDNDQGSLSSTHPNAAGHTLWANMLYANTPAFTP